MSHGDFAAVFHAEMFINAYRDRTTSPEPIRLPGAWRAHDPNADVTAEMRAELEERLNAISAFPT